MTHHTIEVRGKGAFKKVMEAISKAYPTSTAEAGGQVLRSIHASDRLTKEIKNTMSHEDRIEALDAALTKIESKIENNRWMGSEASGIDRSLSKIESELDGLLKQKLKNRIVQDDWSQAGDDPNDVEDTGDDSAEYDDEADDTDDDDDELNKLAYRIRKDQGLPAMEAKTEARLARPDLYKSLSRGRGVPKGSFNDLVNVEMAKGVTDPVCAAQRVLTKYGAAANDMLAKSASSSEFTTYCTEIMKRNGVSRTAAMTRARLERPAAFRRFQLV